MSEKSPHQPAPETTNKGTWLKELNSKKTRELVLSHILSMKMEISREDAEDLVQQVMFKAARAIEANQFRGDSKLTSWLYEITKNAALDLLREQKKSIRTTPLSDAPELASKEPTSEEMYLTAEAAKKLRSRLNELSPKLREVTELIVEGLDYKQITERLGISLVTAKTRYFRARNFLKESIKNEDQK